MHKRTTSSIAHIKNRKHKKNRKMSNTGPMPNYKTIDDYIANQPIEAQKILKELRSIIKEAVPDAIEIQNYKVPSFILVPGTKTELQIMMVSYSKFVSFYPFPATIEHFTEELKGFKTGKGSINFSFDKQLPKDLIIRMVTFRKEEIIKNSK